MTEDIAKMIGAVVIVIGVVILGLALGASVSLLLAFPVKWCWNLVMPYLFGLPTLTWGNAWCLMFLANCLLKPHGWDSKATKKE